MRREFILVYLSVIIQLARSYLDNWKGFDDSIMYKINWPGPVDELDWLDTDEQMVVKTNQQETYVCHLPPLSEKQKTSDDEYTGPSPIDLLAHLFSSSTCTTLIEPYWSYELCHGRHIRQYHEEREGKKIKLQEYKLGKWDDEKTKTMSEEFEKMKKEGVLSNPPIKKLDGINLPYLQLNYTDGTLCDLNGKPRRTNVLYVCFMGGKNDIFIIKETSSCEYEAIVTSSELCKHPKYRPQLTEEHEIKCVPRSGAPTKPKSLTEIELEALKQRRFSSGLDKSDKMYAMYSIGEYEDKDGKIQVRVRFRPLDGDDLEGDVSSEAESPVETPKPNKSPESPANSDATYEVPFNADEFLSGRACPEGGYGWWKYRFCFYHDVEQYHLDVRGVRNSIILGSWGREAHIAWLAKNPHKKPRPAAQRTHLTYFYGNGDICPETGKPRETEVKLKCSPSRKSASLYLIEPSTCQYILGVESSVICAFIEAVDENGLI